MKSYDKKKHLIIIDNDKLKNKSNANIDLVTLENRVKSFSSVKYPLHSTLIIDADNYIVKYLTEYIINPFVLRVSSTFKEASAILNDCIVDHVVMEVFNLEEQPLHAIKFIYNIRVRYPSIFVTIFTSTRNVYILQLLRSFDYINIVSKYERLSELQRAVNLCWSKMTFYSEYIIDIMIDVPIPDTLNDMEMEILIKLANYTSKHEIAKSIKKSYHSIFYYIRKINGKLRLQTKNEHNQLINALNNNPLKYNQWVGLDKVDSIT
ncbi:response regulator transcription factor [Klebsiella aerogenes]|nr:response regulator transcription factor [Klebsiella aerogenes]